MNEYVELPSALNINNGSGIFRACGRSVLFTMKHSEWEELKTLYGTNDAFENNLICECSVNEYQDKGRQQELATQVTGYEAQPSK